MERSFTCQPFSVGKPTGSQQCQFKSKTEEPYLYTYITEKLALKLNYIFLPDKSGMLPLDKQGTKTEAQRSFATLAIQLNHSITNTLYLCLSDEAHKQPWQALRINVRSTNKAKNLGRPSLSRKRMCSQKNFKL